MSCKILILGSSGMLGNAMLRLFADSDGFQVKGTARSDRSVALLPERFKSLVISGVDCENIDNLLTIFEREKPDIVINCIGLIKQKSYANDSLSAISVNSLFPHRLARVCAMNGSRLVHLSTDCVFSGSRGMYLESDFSDANDLYGRSKFLGEVDYSNAITLRTSIIGVELATSNSLVGWFLTQTGSIKGYKRAVFSGLPTVEIARLIRDYVIPNPSLSGVFHVSAEPINKFDLLNLIAAEYEKKIIIECDESLVINRSLDSSRFRSLTGFCPKPWPELVESMREFG